MIRGVYMDPRTFSSLKENVAHGTLLLPYMRYHMFIPESYRDLPAHWHEELEFTLVREGRMAYYVDMVPLQVRSGDLLIISPNTLHSAHEIPDYSALTDSLVFHPNLLGYQDRDACTMKYVEPLMKNTVRFKVLYHPADEGYAELLHSFNDLWECSESRLPGFEIELKEKLFHLLSLIFKYGSCTWISPDTGVPQYEFKIKQVLSYIQHNYTEQITVSRLAEISNFSEVHFMNLFRKSIGCTSMEYVNSYRLAMAAASLENADSTIMNIALENGFRNISYFNRMFLKKFHMTPNAYRRLRKKKR